MMRSKLTDRLRARGSARAVLAVAAAAVVVGPTFASQPALAQSRVASPDADAAQKLLLKATGLFNRSLFKLAAADYGQFLQQFPGHPESANARFALGVCHYRLAEYDKAVEQLAAVARDERFAQRDEALAVVGHARLATRKYADAVAAFDEVVGTFPKSKQAEAAALGRAQALYLSDKHAAAAAAAEGFLTQYPQSADRPTATFFLGLSRKALNQDAAAADTLAGLLRDDPKGRFALDATLVLGQALEAQGKLDEAADRFRQMLAAAPAARRPEAQYSLGAVLYKGAKYADAAKAFEAVVGAAADGPYAKPARLQLGLSHLAAGRVAEARPVLEAVVRDDPPNAAAARYGLAQCDVADRRFDAALAALDDLARLRPPPVNAQQVAFDRAVCLAELNRHDEAAKAFEAYASANAQGPLAAEAIYRQAFSLHKLGRYDRSHALCGQAAKAGSPQFAAAAAELDAENLFLLGKFPDAGKSYATLLEAAKDGGRRDRFTFRLGQCAYSQNDFARAVDLLRPLAGKPKVAGDPALGRAVFLLGDALLQQGKHADAAEALRRFLADLKPGDNEPADRQEAQYKLAYALLRAAGPGDAPPASAAELLSAVAGGPEASPWTTRARFELGQLAYQAKPPRPAEAAEAFKRVLAADGGKPPEDLAAPALYFLGWVAFDDKRYDEAAADWSDVARRFPKASVAADAAFHRGVALREGRKHAEALKAFEAYESANPAGPHVAKARQLSAACLAALDRHDEARKILASLADGGAPGGKPAAADAVLYDLAWAQKQTKDDAAAAASYRRLLKEHPRSKLAPAAGTELAELLVKEKKPAEAVALLEPVATAADADPKVRALAMALLGTAYKAAGQTEKAAGAFAAYAAAFPDDRYAGDALLQAGESAASLGRFADAERSLADLLKRFPQHPQANLALLKLAEAQADGGKFDDALASHRSFLAKYPKDPFGFRAQFGVGWALQNARKFPEAREAYAKVTAATNGETAARAQFQVGETYCEEGNFEKAVPALLAVEDVYAYPAWSARALVEAGRAFEQLKQPDQAKAQYTAVATKYKDQADEAKVARERLKELKG